MSEKLARRFHEIYERLAPSFGYETREETLEFLPKSKNGRLMIAVTDEIEKDLAAECERLREGIREIALAPTHGCNAVFQKVVYPVIDRLLGEEKA